MSTWIAGVFFILIGNQKAYIYIPKEDEVYFPCHNIAFILTQIMVWVKVAPYIQ